MRLYLLVALTLTLLPAVDAMAAGNSLAWETFYDLGTRLLKSGELQDAEKQITLAMKEAQHFGPQDVHVLKTMKLLSQLYKAQNKTAEEASINKVIAEMEGKLGQTAAPAAAAAKPAWMVPSGDAAHAEKAASAAASQVAPPAVSPAAAAVEAASPEASGSAEASATATYPPYGSTTAAPATATAAPVETTVAPSIESPAPSTASATPSTSTISPTPSPSETPDVSTYGQSSAPTRQATELKQLAGHINWVKSIVYSKDGTRAVSGGADNSVRLWDITQGKQIRMYPGHTNQVNCVAFTPDERYIVSGSDDCTVRVFDVESGNQLACYRGYSNLITSIDISADGKRAITGSYDRTARVLSCLTAKK